MVFGRRVVVGLIVLAVSAASLQAAPDSESADSKPADSARQIQQLLTKLRTSDSPAKRAAAVKELASLGPEGIAAVKDLLEKDLARIASPDGGAAKPTKIDEKIAALRKTLADLRNDPELSKDKLTKTGLPALDQLAVLYRQQSKTVAAQQAKAARAAGQLKQLTALLDALDEQWEVGDAPLPMQDYRMKAQELSAALASPDTAAHEVLQANAALAPKLDREIVAGMNAVNTMRMMCGLNPLAYDLKLCKAAEGHAADMEKKNFFSHESPVTDKKTPWDRAQLAGTTASGENIYMGSTVAMDALKGWFLSPPHHKNMLNDGNKRQGLGRSGKYWTQMFGN